VYGLYVGLELDFGERKKFGKEESRKSESSNETD
jgi:hypothetical protein